MSKMLLRLMRINRVILSVGHERGVDSGAVNEKGEKEVDQNIALVSKIQMLLTLARINVLVVADYSLSKTCDYINTVGNAYTDLAVEIHKDSTDDFRLATMQRRMGIYAHPTSTHALQAAVKMRDVMITEGAAKTTWARPDTDSRHKSLAFIRQVKMLSFIAELGFIQDDNSEEAQWFYAECFTKALCTILEKPFVSRSNSI